MQLSKEILTDDELKMLLYKMVARMESKQPYYDTAIDELLERDRTEHVVHTLLGEVIKRGIASSVFGDEPESEEGLLKRQLL